MILAVDPGTTESGWCLYDAGAVVDSGVAPNHDLLEWIQHSKADVLAIEMIANMGMAVGKSTFDTVRWVGRFQQAWRAPEDVQFVYRHQVKQLLCGSQRAKDTNVRASLIDRFGPGRNLAVGVKARPGPLYGVRSHAWSALAVAITAQETI